VGGDAVVYADPLSVDSIRGALAHLLGSPDERARLGAAAQQRAREFSWERTARETLVCLEQAAKRA
jgi:glycosyltransferase involved in cell wall biosynthesis